MKNPIRFRTCIFALFMLTCSFVNAQEIITTPSGLKYFYQKKGSGPIAKEGLELLLKVKGYFPAGDIFWTSEEIGSTFDIVLGKTRLIDGFNECVALMRIGDIVTCIIPPHLGYKEKGSGETIPPNATLMFDIELIGMGKTRIPITDTLFVTLKEHGIKKMTQLYKTLKKQNAKYNTKESELNILGYRLLNENMPTEAIDVFNLNAKAYPKSWRVYNSLGEGYLHAKDTTRAIKYYKRSQTLNPKAENTIRMLNKLLNEE